MNLATTLFAIATAASILALAVLAVASRRLRRAGTTMRALEFLARMLRRARYDSVGPAELERRLAPADVGPLVVDLREGVSYARGHIAGAVHHPFDDFLKAVVVDRAYDAHRLTGRELVLACDTGQMSRVAAEILVEDEGFANVVNLRGGMRRWQRWRDSRERRAGRCCGVALPSCCTAAGSTAG